MRPWDTVMNQIQMSHKNVQIFFKSFPLRVIVWCWQIKDGPHQSWVGGVGISQYLTIS